MMLIMDHDDYVTICSQVKRAIKPSDPMFKQQWFLNHGAKVSYHVFAVPSSIQSKHTKITITMAIVTVTDNSHEVKLTLFIMLIIEGRNGHECSAGVGKWFHWEGSCCHNPW